MNMQIVVRKDGIFTLNVEDFEFSVNNIRVSRRVIQMPN